MIISGTIYWCKLDEPRDNYNKKYKLMNKDGEPEHWGREYSVIIGNLDKESKIQLRDAGLLDKVKNKMDDLEDHIMFRLDEFDRDGEPQEFKVVNGETGEPWDWKKDGPIGNLSKGAVKFNVWKKPGIKARIYPVSMLVTEHVEYEAPEGAAEREDPDDWSSFVKGFVAPAKEQKAKTKIPVEELEDDVPY